MVHVRLLPRGRLFPAVAEGFHPRLGATARLGGRWGLQPDSNPVLEQAQACAPAKAGRPFIARGGSPGALGQWGMVMVHVRPLPLGRPFPAVAEGIHPRLGAAARLGGRRGLQQNSPSCSQAGASLCARQGGPPLYCPGRKPRGTGAQGLWGIEASGQNRHN